jgi:hypothetical protein
MVFVDLTDAFASAGLPNLFGKDSDIEYKNNAKKC